jgi:hypothetical protein
VWSEPAPHRPNSKGNVSQVDKSPVAAILTVALVFSPFAIVGCLKGRYALSIIGLFILFGIPSILAAARLARADSWWAGRFYDETKLIETGHRYPGNSNIGDAFTL